MRPIASTYRWQAVMRIILPLIGAVVILGTVLGLGIGQAQGHPPNPASCIAVARDLHLYAILYRAGAPDRWGDTLPRMVELWRSLERSEAYALMGNRDAWDEWWAKECYEKVLAALERQ